MKYENRVKELEAENAELRRLIHEAVATEDAAIERGAVRLGEFTALNSIRDALRAQVIESSETVEAPTIVEQILMQDYRQNTHTFVVYSDGSVRVPRQGSAFEGNK